MLIDEQLAILPEWAMSAAGTAAFWVKVKQADPGRDECVICYSWQIEVVKLAKALATALLARQRLEQRLKAARKAAAYLRDLWDGNALLVRGGLAYDVHNAFKVLKVELRDEEAKDADR